MNSKLTVLYDLKDKYESKYEEFEDVLLDDEVGKHEFELMINQMAGLRIAIRIIENQILEETRKK